MSGPAQGAADSTSAVGVHNFNGDSKIILVCEHASNTIPAQFNNLGLSALKVEEHIAWDPGAFGTARRLADMIDAPLVYANVSRLVLDINREPDHRGSIVEVSELTEIPGNKGLTQSERRARVRAVYEPFHAMLGTVIQSRDAKSPWLISLHSYTPVFKGVQRPWHVGILHNDDTRLSTRLLDALKKDSGLVVGDNEPYAPTDGVYHTIEKHTVSRGYAGAMVEIRNDLIADESGEQDWAARFNRILNGMLASTHV